MLGLSRRALYRRLERLDLADSISRRREPELAGMASSSQETASEPQPERLREANLSSRRALQPSG